MWKVDTPTKADSTASQRCFLLLLLAACYFQNSQALLLPNQYPHSTTQTSATTTTTTSLGVIDPQQWTALANAAIDPQTTTTVGVALLSAAAGAASQVPKIQSLEYELATTKEELTLSQEQMQAKVVMLEDQLYHMDEEFEQQTARFQKQYDTQKQKELAQITNKLKDELKFKLDIELEKEKSKLLTNQYNKIAVVSDQKMQLTKLQSQQEQLHTTNAKLEEALLQASEELDRLKEESSAWNDRKRFFGMF